MNRKDVDKMRKILHSLPKGDWVWDGEVDYLIGEDANVVPVFIEGQGAGGVLYLPDKKELHEYGTAVLDFVCEAKKHMVALLDHMRYGHGHGVDGSSWFSGECTKCGYNVVVTQPDADEHPVADYWWYCSNKKCEHHDEGQHTGDMENPEWVDLSTEWCNQ